MTFMIIGLEKLCKEDVYRKNRENLWKKKLNTFSLYGITTKMSVADFLQCKPFTKS